MKSDKDIEIVTKDNGDSMFVKRRQSIEEINILKMDCEVKVTYHKFDVFFKMFSQYFNELRNSLSPKFNRDQVFMSGEGAGRSGSFFFFSHDKKFIIKTMTQ